MLLLLLADGNNTTPYGRGLSTVRSRVQRKDTMDIESYQKPLRLFVRCMSSQGLRCTASPPGANCQLLPGADDAGDDKDTNTSSIHVVTPMSSRLYSYCYTTSPWHMDPHGWPPAISLSYGRNLTSSSQTQLRTTHAKTQPRTHQQAQRGLH